MLEKKIENFDPSYTSQDFSGKKFSDELVEKFKGKMIELYIGDQYESLNFEDFSQQQNASIYGKLIEVLDRFVILDCFFVDKKGELHTGNYVYINTFQIRAMTAIDGRGSLNDIFLSAKDVAKIKKAMKLKGHGTK